MSAPRASESGNTRSAARHELVLTASIVIVLSRLVDGPAAWLVAVLLGGSLVASSPWLLGAANPRSIPVESTILPALAAVASLGAIRVIPGGVATLIAIAGAAFLIDRTLALEVRLHLRVSPPSADDRTLVLAYSVVTGFLAFVGVAALVEGGLVASTVGPAAGADSLVGLSEAGLLVLALADALVAGLLGFRLAVMRERNQRTAVLSGLTYAAVVAIAAGAIRAVALPSLLGPAIVTLVFFLWDGIHGSAPAQRRDPRWIWQTALLFVLGLAVVAWNLALR
jgi:hypothetical protein